MHDQADVIFYYQTLFFYISKVNYLSSKYYIQVTEENVDELVKTNDFRNLGGLVLQMSLKITRCGGQTT